MDMELFLRDVRCFDKQHKFRIRPLTFLVGENSTGKSTVLGCMQVLSRALREHELDFNVEPFQMGAFANIVRKSRPLNTEFQLGWEGKGIPIKGASSFVLRLVEKTEGQEPVISAAEWRIGNKKITVKVALDSEREMLDEELIQFSKSKDELHFHVPLKTWRYVFHFLDWHDILDGMPISLDMKEQSWNELRDWMEDLDWQEIRMMMHGMKTQSIAPIRSKPRRTYNPLNETEHPEGSEIPTTMMNLSRVSKESWQILQEKLSGFGRNSGLFSSIEVRKLGKSGNDPFQLQVAARGKTKINLIDVGYGTSQILPVLVRIFQQHGTRFLLQQPEVHLHPKGQAEFSSLLVQNIKENGNAFVVETHSDYMINRARIEIRNGKIKPEDVSLIYFEPKKNGNSVVSHNIEFDEQGNMQNVPEGHRDFFLKETETLLGF